MLIQPVVQIDPGVDLQTAVAALLKVAENVEIVRWIELPASVLLFLLVPGELIQMGDAPACNICGSLMVRSGTCYRCMTCGSTSGCS